MHYANRLKVQNARYQNVLVKEKTDTSETPIKLAIAFDHSIHPRDIVTYQHIRIFISIYIDTISTTLLTVAHLDVTFHY